MYKRQCVITVAVKKIKKAAMNRVFHFFMEISPLAVMIYWRARDQKRKKLAEPVFYYYTSIRGMFRPIDSYICIEKRLSLIHISE
ncbi:hypothetical protein ACQ4LK_21765, partial [Bacillus pumilus]